MGSAVRFELECAGYTLLKLAPFGALSSDDWRYPVAVEDDCTAATKRARVGT